jgi:hypothetical protein
MGNKCVSNKSATNTCSATSSDAFSLATTSLDTNTLAALEDIDLKKTDKEWIMYRFIVEWESLYCNILNCKNYSDFIVAERLILYMNDFMPEFDLKCLFNKVISDVHALYDGRYNGVSPSLKNKLLSLLYINLIVSASNIKLTLNTIYKNTEHKINDPRIIDIFQNMNDASNRYFTLLLSISRSE